MRTMFLFGILLVLVIIAIKKPDQTAWEQGKQQPNKRPPGASISCRRSVRWPIWARTCGGRELRTKGDDIRYGTT